MRRVVCSALILVLVLVGCGNPHPTSSTQSDISQQESSQPQTGRLSPADFGLAGLTLATPVADVRVKLGVPSGHRLGGYHLVSAGQSLYAYLGPGDTAVSALAGPVIALSTNNQRLRLTSERQTTTREQVRAAYGDPFKHTVDGDEYWFYTDSDRTQVLIFTFRQAEGWLVKDVQIASVPTATRQWYPLLGEVDGPKPVVREDAALGTGLVGMNADNLVQSFGQLYQEGEKRPYQRNQYRNGALVVTFDNQVRFMQLKNDTTLATPRGIKIGSSVVDVRKAYGPTRVYQTAKGELWAYENLRQHVCLVFQVQDGVVTSILAGDSDYLFWDTVG